MIGKVNLYCGVITSLFHLFICLHSYQALSLEPPPLDIFFSLLNISRFRVHPPQSLHDRNRCSRNGWRFFARENVAHQRDYMHAMHRRKTREDRFVKIQDTDFPKNFLYNKILQLLPVSCVGRKYNSYSAHASKSYIYIYLLHSIIVVAVRHINDSTIGR